MVPFGASCWPLRRSTPAPPSAAFPTPTSAAGGRCTTMGWRRCGAGPLTTSTPTRVSTQLLQWGGEYCSGEAAAARHGALWEGGRVLCMPARLLGCQVLPRLFPTPSNLPAPPHQLQTEVLKRQRDEAERKRTREERRKAKAAAEAAAASAPPKPVAPAGPVAFLFPGQGSQAVGMLKVGRATGGGGRMSAFDCSLPCPTLPAIGHPRQLTLTPEPPPSSPTLLPPTTGVGEAASCQEDAGNCAEGAGVRPAGAVQRGAQGEAGQHRVQPGGWVGGGMRACGWLVKCGLPIRQGCVWAGVGSGGV